MFVCGGFGGHGFKQGAHAGVLLANMIVDQSDPVELQRYKPDRFCKE
jgi:glycine/D-amino acid oxidase-like deaminating enzyme